MSVALVWINQRSPSPVAEEEPMRMMGMDQLKPGPLCLGADENDGKIEPILTEQLFRETRTGLLLDSQETECQEGDALACRPGQSLNYSI